MAPPATKPVPIPEPRGLPYLGHVAEFRSEDSIQDLDRLFDIHGNLFRLRFPGIGSCVFIGTHKLVNEVFDESRFKKSIQADLGEVRKAVHDGLFTADSKEKNWGLAHRILLPAFGPAAIRNMFDEMYDVLTQMALKWARHGPDSPIPCSDHFTRLALDTLALCSMGYRFNSFYQEELHEFVQSMEDSLTEFGKRTARPKWTNPLFFSAGRKLSKDITLMRKISRELIESRKADPNSTSKRDLLTAMLDGVDPKTGAKLSDESIINNLITFLVAGHETTSGTLSFAFYSILKNPEVYRKAQQEIDEVMGRDRVTVDKLFKLKYIPALLRETLRQCSPIPGIIVEPLEDTMLAGKYPVKKAEPIIVAFSRTHLDPAVYGDDARQFQPERMLEENFDRLEKEFPNCWKPFGNGMRACIGRPFAWQEMLLATSVLLQNFNFYQQDPSYILKISETLTIKPKGFFVRASLRHGMTALDLEHHLSGKAKEKRNSDESTLRSLSTAANGSTAAKPLSIYFGSNSGTCEVLAHRLALNASAHGFRASTVDALDLAKDRITSKDPMVILTASYEGQPPDNAAHFVDWLENTSDELGNDVSYAVFGVGNSEWRQTFHRIPKLVDDRLTKKGATRLAPLGLTDVAKHDPFLGFESWEDEFLWPALTSKFTNLDPLATANIMGMHVDVSSPRCSTLRQNVVEAVVNTEKVLTTQEMPLKKHIEIKLPEHLSYEAGDYIAVLPINPSHIVRRVFRRFKLVRDANVTIQGNEAALLPMQGPTSAWEVFSSYVELSAPATRKNILTIAMHAEDNTSKAELQSLAKDANHPSESKNGLSLLDILEQHPLVEVPIGIFLSMLPPIRTRQYSISSSPLWNPQIVSLTYSVLERTLVSGDGKYVGVATSYLASLKPGDRIHVSVRRSHAPFHPPRDPKELPIICIAAGAGIAPFRGFIQQRAIQIKSMKTLAPALVIYGCRDIGDDLYRDEFDTWEAEGVAQIRRAYSRQQDKTNGCKYVQDRIREQKQLIKEMWNNGAKVFVCGGCHIGDAVERSFIELLSELYSVEQTTARGILDKTRGERFAVDIFG